MGIASALRNGSKKQKSRLAHALAFAVVAASCGASLSAHADTYANNGGTSLNAPGSWIDLTTPGNTGIGVPGATDIASFDSNDANAAPTTYNLGAPTSWLGLLVSNPAAAVTIDTGANPLTLGASGIDMSAATQNVTLSPQSVNVLTSQTWNVAASRTLTVNSPVAINGTQLTITSAGNGTTSIAGTISGTGALGVSGGVVTLTGGNTYTGGTNLTSGTLNIGNSQALGTGTITISGGTYNNTSAGSLTISGNIAQAWNGSFIYGGTQAMTMGTGAVTLGATPTITVNGAGATGVLIEQGVISGAFGITKAGTGNLTLTGANTFTGPVTVNAGILNFNGIAALGAGTAINLNGGTLQYGGAGDDISGRTVTILANSTIDTNGQNVTFANSIGNGGAGNFVKTGIGTLVLAATNSYTGNTTVQGSTATGASVLNFSGLASLGSGPAINIANGTLQYAAGNSDDITSRTVNTSGTLATIDLNGNSVAYANTINGTSGITFANSNSSATSTITLNAARAYTTGAVTAGSNVTLVLGNSATLSSAVLGVNTGGNVSFGTATAVTVGGLTGTGNIALVNSNSQAVPLTIAALGGTFNGVLSDGGLNVSVTKVGASNEVFGGSSTAGQSNNYNGDTIVDGGTLTIGFGGTDVQLADILYSQVAAGLETQGSEGRLVLGGGTLAESNRANGATYQQFASTVINQGGSQVNQAGRNSGSAPQLYLYGITRNVGGTVDFVSANNNTNVGVFTTTLNNASGIIGGWATQNNNADWAHVGTGTGQTLGGVAPGNAIGEGAAKNGTYQTATYTTAATPATAFANNTINTDMTANLTAPSGNTTGSIRFNTPGTIALTTTGANVDASGGILITPTVAGNAVSIVPTAGSSITSGNGTDLIVIQADATTGNSFTIATPIVNNGATSIALTKSGVGPLILSGNNTFTGGVYLNSGTLQLNNAGALNSTTPNFISFGNAYQNVSGTLTLNGNSLTTPMISTANVQVGTPVIQNANATAPVLTVNGSTASTFNGTMQDGSGGGSLGLVVGGSGGLTLSGSNNTYTGNTTILSGGKLALSAASNNISGSKTILVNGGGTLSLTGVTGGFTLAAGQTLTGNGTITGTLGVGSSAVLNPGTAGVGTLTTDGLTLSPNATVNLDFGSSNNDLVVVNNSGGLVINGTAGTVNLNLLNAANGGTPFLTAGTYDLFQYSGSIGGTGLGALTDANAPFGTSATFGTATVGGLQYMTVTLVANTSGLPTWNLNGSGSWAVGNNWTPPGVPNGQGQTAVFGSSITAPSTVTLDGSATVGTIAFISANSYTIAQGTGGSLILDNGATTAHLYGSLGNHSITAPVVLNSNLTASITAGSVALNGVVSEGTAGKSITMSGAGTLVLTNANTYTGGTILNSGTVQVSNNAALGTGGVSFASTAALQAGSNVVIGNAISLANAGTVGTIDTQGNNVTLSGVISSTSPAPTLNKIGSGTAILTAANTFNGTVTVNGGTLQVGDGVSTTASLGAATLVTNANLAYNMPATTTIANSISGTGFVVQNAANTLTLTGSNTFSGGMIINNGGTVVLGGTAQNAAGSGPITINNNGTLTLNNTNSGTLFNNVVVPTGSTGTMNMVAAGDFNGAVVGGGTLNFVVQGTGGTIDGDWSSFTGQVNLIAPATGTGDFKISTANFTAPAAKFNVPANVNFYTSISGGQITIGDLTGAGNLVGNNNTAGLFVGAAETAGVTSVFSGTITDGAGGIRPMNITKNGPGTLDLAANMGSEHGAIAVNQGTLSFLGATSPMNITSGIAVAAGATLDLGGNNATIATYTNGAFTATSTGLAGGVGSTVGNSSTTTPSTINVNGTSTFAGSIIDSLNGGTQTIALVVNGGTETLTGTNTYTGGTQINAGTLQLGSGGTTGSIVATATTTIIDNGLLTFNRSDNVAFGAIISGSGGVTKNGTGVLTLTNAGSSFGTMTVTAGTLQMVAGVPLGSGQEPVVANGGVFDLNGTSTTVGSLSGAAAGVVDNVAAGGAATLTTGSLNADVTFAGTIKNTTGTVALVKNGTGNLTLSGGTSTYSGGTTLNSGAIYATNATGSATGTGPVVLNGGTLGGTGNFGGVITAGSGPHTISPGATANTIGTLTAGGLSTNANTTLAVDLAAPGGTNDLLAITGNVSLNGGNVTLTTNPLSGQGSLGYYKIMTYTGMLSGAGMTVAATSTVPNVIYTLDTSTAGVINVHKGFIGDANDDGGVDLTDLSTVLNNFGSATTSWSLGNFDGASTIDLTDLSDVLNNFGSTVASTAVGTTIATPEPTSLALLVPAAAALLRRRRGR